MSTEPRHVISMAPRQPEVPGEATVCSASVKDSTVKPVCNDHLYNEIYYMWLIQ